MHDISRNIGFKLNIVISKSKEYQILDLGRTVGDRKLPLPIASI